MFTYKVDETNTVSIYADGAESPLILQDINPSGEAWANLSEATAWAEDYIAKVEAQIAADALIVEAEEAAEVAPVEEVTE